MGKKGTLDYCCNRRHFLKTLNMSLGTIAATSLLDISPIFAKEVYPAGKIVCVLSQKPGAGYDMLARGIGPYLTHYLKEASPGATGGNLIVKNETAAAGQKAASIIYDAKPDGYTISIFDISFAVETLLSEKVPFDIQKFTYLLQINAPSRLLVTSKNGFANWAEMVNYSKTKELKWGVAALGRAIHIDSIIAKEDIGIPIRFVPFGATAENMNALIRGDINVAMISEGSVEGLIEAKEIKVLTQFAAVSNYPGVPSIKELGYPALAEKLGLPRFVIAPPNLPKDIRNTLIKAFRMSISDKKFQDWAMKNKVPLTPIYGDEADKIAQNKIKYYRRDVMPILKKYL